MKNRKILLNLQKLSEKYSSDPKLKFKYNAINRAIVEIKKTNFEIESGKYAKENIKHIGDGIANRIDEILKCGFLEELNNISKNDMSVTNLKKITGVGDKKAKELVNMGIYNIDQYKREIIKGNIKSTHHIDIGIKYYDDFLLRIPRNEIEKMKIILEKSLSEISEDLQLEICGSYRRGNNTCGDIDVLVSTKSKKNIDNKYLQKYIQKLKNINFLYDDLTINGSKKYMGVCKINSKFRRIDIRFVEFEIFYPALIYFTGSKNLNIELRKLAIKKGYSLSEYGIQNKKNNKLIVFNSEKEIFDFLEYPYLKPIDRNL